jgi:nucleotide-binding universal stress UspA family protein
MFQHILVPLDGSSLSEKALLPAAVLGQTLGATVTLLHVIERNAPQEIHGDRHLTTTAEALEYLKKTALKSFPPGVKVDTHVHTEEVSNVPRSIIEHAGEFEPDLIVMCAHGEGGLRDLVVGSIAEQVIGHGKTPILLVQPKEGLEELKFTFKNFLVALDGQSEHDQGLYVSAKLAKCTGAELNLLTVVPTMGTLKGNKAATSLYLPGATAAMLEYTEDSARDYLKERSATLAKTGLVAQIEVRRGDPAAVITGSAENSKVDLIVLCTHGKAGMGAFWAGSVAPRVVGMTQIPILLVPAVKGTKE